MVGIGFFAPFPLALMIPFMAGQSLAMGEAFGKGFQYGKRKISSMSNEDFNKLNFQELSESIATDYRVMIPSITKSIEASDQLQSKVFQALGDLIKSIPVEVLNFLGGGAGQPGASGGTLTSYGTSATSAQLVDPRGISSLFTLWENMGIIPKGSKEKFDEQFTTAKATARYNASEGVGKVTQLAKANRLAQEARDKRARDEQAKRVIVARENENELNIQRARQTAVTTKRKAGRSQIGERRLLIRQLDQWGKLVRAGGGGVSLQVRKKQLRTLQIRMENLLNRYTF